MPTQEGITNRIATTAGITVTVNTAVNSVNLVVAGTPDLSINGIIGNIAEGENCIIEGFSLALPYQFGQGEFDSVGFARIGWRDDSGNNDPVTELGANGQINIPDPNYWYDTFTYVPFPTAADSKWHFEILAIVFEVSMFNVPAALNTEELLCQFHLKIRTTTELIA